MSTPITDIMLDATSHQKAAAVHHMSARLGIPPSVISMVAAVAYVARHYTSDEFGGGRGWPAFVADQAPSTKEN